MPLQERERTTDELRKNCNHQNFSEPKFYSNWILKMECRYTPTTAHQCSIQVHIQYKWHMMKNTKKNTRHTQLGFQRPIQMQKAQFHHSECKLRNFSKTKNDLFLTRRAPLRELDVRFVFSLSPTTLNSSRTFCGSLFHWVANKTHVWIFLLISLVPSTEIPHQASA